jgi:Flp pilus assembly pilin Flp
MHPRTAESFPAVARPQNENPAIRTNRRTDLNSDLTGEQTMSFLKNLLIEEDGQDMVEYGLVVAAVVVAGVAAFAGYSGKLTSAFSTLEAAITAAL